MKKTYLYILTISLMFAFPVILLSAGNIKRETKVINNSCKYIVNNTVAKIIVSQGDKNEMNIEADEDIFDKVEVKQEGSKIIISMEPGLYLNIKKFSVFLTLKEIKGIKSSGSGDILTTGQIKTDDFTLLIEGAGDAKISNLVADKITIAVWGSGDVTAAGVSKQFNCEIAGSGDVNAIRIKAKEANVKITGSGDCAIDAKELLVMQITGSGDVYIKDHPKILKTAIKGQGELKFY